MTLAVEIGVRGQVCIQCVHMPQTNELGKRTGKTPVETSVLLHATLASTAAP